MRILQFGFSPRMCHTGTMSSVTLDQLLRPSSPAGISWVFQLGLEFVNKPELLDQIASPACDLDGVDEDVLAGVWKMLDSLNRAELASPFLGKLDLQRVNLERVMRPVSLMNKDLRSAWLDFLEQDHPGTEGQKYHLLRTTMLPLLEEWMYGSKNDAMDEPAQAWLRRWLDVADKQGEQCRGFLANSGLTRVITCHTRSPAASDRLEDIARGLVEGGAKLNEKRLELYEQIAQAHDEARIKHPNRVHECLYRWKRYGHEGRNELAAILVTLGGSWKAAMNDPFLADVARVTLEDHPLVKRHALKRLAVKQGGQAVRTRKL